MNTDSIIIKQFIQEHPKEAARELEKFQPDILAPFFTGTLVELLLEVIPFMDPQVMLKVFNLMQPGKVVQLLESLDIHYTVLLVRMMDEDLSEKILKMLSSEKSIIIRRQIKYMKNSVGSYMDPTVLTLAEEMTIKEALSIVRRHKSRMDPSLFVLTSDRKIAGVINISDLINEDPAKKIRFIMQTMLITIPPETPFQSIFSNPGWIDHYSLPVVDKTMVFLGVIRLETIRSIQVKSDQRIEDQDQVVISALGELYQIGLAGLLRSATDFKNVQSKE